MSFNIKNEEAHRLARELARRTGESSMAAVTGALRERLARLDAPAGASSPLAGDRPRLRGAAEEPHRSLDHGDFLYDERGLPRCIVDASAVLAILRDEPDAEFSARALAGPRRSRPACRLRQSSSRAAIVIDCARDPIASRRFDDLIAGAGSSSSRPTREQAEAARAAYRDYGKGGRHPAQLTFGDCFA